MHFILNARISGGPEFSGGTAHEIARHDNHRLEAAERGKRLDAFYGIFEEFKLAAVAVFSSRSNDAKHQQCSL